MVLKEHDPPRKTDSATGWPMMDDPWHCLGKMPPITIMGQEYVIRRLLIAADCGSIAGQIPTAAETLDAAYLMFRSSMLATAKHCLRVCSCMLRKLYWLKWWVTFYAGYASFMMPGRLRGPQLALEREREARREGEKGEEDEKKRGGRRD